MGYGYCATDKTTSTPPSQPILWQARARGIVLSAIALRWFEAREAMRADAALMGIEADEVEVEMVGGEP